MLVLIFHFITLSYLFRNPKVADHLYQNQFYKFFRKGYDQTIGQLDFPFIYMLFPMLLLLLGIDIYRKRKTGIFNILAFLFNYFSIFFVLFYVFWAYNYSCTPLEKRMNLEDVSIDKKYIETALIQLKPQLEKLRSELDTSLRHEYHSKTLEDLVRPELKKILSTYGYYVKSDARVKQIFDGGLMRLRTSGIYISYVFEGHFDGSIHRIQWPFTIAHEMAHAYGVTDEKECNFLAFLVCSRSTNQHLKYSGLIAYWRYLATALIREDADKYKTIRGNLSDEILEDLNAINQAIGKYPELMPDARDKVYDQYLKSHGIKEGIISYDKMIEMIAAWENIK